VVLRCEYDDDDDDDDDDEALARSSAKKSEKKRRADMSVDFVEFGISWYSRKSWSL